MSMKNKFLRLIVALAVLVIAAIRVIMGNSHVGVTRYEVESSRIPAAFDHFKIAVISDLHNAEFGTDNSHLLKLIEFEAPDMIAITGDLIDSNRTDIRIAEELIDQIVDIAPSYYVIGNHEAWIGAEYQETEEMLLDKGVIVLHDETVKLVRDDGSIQIAGLDDPAFSGDATADGEELINSRLKDMETDDSFCILLSHRPEIFDVYVSMDIDLVLSGHAHGGQFRLPFIGGLIAPDQGFLPEYDAGKYIEDNTLMIVSRGLGNSIVPIRFNNDPELVIVELKSIQ